MSHLLLLLLPALIVVESNGDWTMVGTAGERGGLQITSQCVEDVNRIYGTTFAPEDAYDPSQAKAICIAYLTHWGNELRRRERREPTLQDLARIWNGGPTGYRKPETLPYWRKVRRQLTYPSSGS